MADFLRNLFSPSCRSVLSFLVFWGQIQNYMMRVSLPFILVCMVKEDSHNVTSTNDDNNNTVVVERCVDADDNMMEVGGNSTGTGTGSAMCSGELDWDQMTQVAYH